MFYNLALFNGVMLTLMIFFNGKLANSIGVYLSGLIFHLIGLLFILIITYIKKSKVISFREILPSYTVPGVISIFVTILNVLCVPKIGVTLTSGISLYAQLLTSALIEHFGFFSITKKPLTKDNILAFSIISLGIFVMIKL